MFRFFQVLELIFVFVGIPLIYKYNYIPVHKSIPLIAIFLIYLSILLKDKNFNSKIFSFNHFRKWKPIFIRLIIFFVVCSLYVFFFEKDHFFDIPRERPLLWLAILFFYPIWSAFTQELIYRAYFFHRFHTLLSNRIILILINAALFSFSHIIFNNWLAIILTFSGSLLFTNTYHKSNSLLVVFVEHSLFGNIIFTVGLGHYFYLPL